MSPRQLILFFTDNFMLQILVDETGLNYVCQTAERFFAVSNVLSNMVTALVRDPSVRLLKHIIRCYLRLSENPYDPVPVLPLHLVLTTHAWFTELLALQSALCPALNPFFQARARCPAPLLTRAAALAAIYGLPQGRRGHQEVACHPHSKPEHRADWGQQLEAIGYMRATFCLRPLCAAVMLDRCQHLSSQSAFAPQ
jgi:hypothetical protein